MRRKFTLLELLISIGAAGIIIVLGGASLQGCRGDIDTGNTTKKEMEQTERNHERLVAAVPPPVLQTSQERLNLKKRLERFNSKSKISHIYLFSAGRFISHHKVKGKVSSVSSFLTTPDQIVTIRDGVTGTNKQRFVVASPGLDGSYGTNGGAIFFFDASDTYIEWSGTYLLSGKPLELGNAPQRTPEALGKPTTSLDGQ